jgi:hypothetical protein
MLTPDDRGERKTKSIERRDIENPLADPQALARQQRRRPAARGLHFADANGVCGKTGVGQPNPLRARMKMPAGGTSRPDAIKIGRPPCVYV